MLIKKLQETLLKEKKNVGLIWAIHLIGIQVNQGPSVPLNYFELYIQYYDLSRINT